VGRDRGLTEEQPIASPESAETENVKNVHQVPAFTFVMTWGTSIQTMLEPLDT